MGQRLTKDVRKSIQGRIIVHRFTDEVVALIAAARSLANNVYDDVYPKEAQARMKAIPAGWLPGCNNIKVQLGDSSRDYVYLSFNGDTVAHGELFLGYGDDVPWRPPQENRLMPSKDVSLVVRVYDVGHAFTKRWEEIGAAQSDLAKRIKDAKAVVFSALHSFSSVKAALDAWPELEPFMKDYTELPPNLPALPRAKLNAMLDLPATEVLELVKA